MKREDAAVIFGSSKAQLPRHCGGDPAPTGTTADCGECGRCVGAACVPNPLRAGRQCSADGDACTDDTCSGGQCAHPALSSTVVIEAVYVDRADRQRTWSSSPASAVAAAAAVWIAGMRMHASST